jgi:hypothetical protein
MKPTLLIIIIIIIIIITMIMIMIVLAYYSTGTRRPTEQKTSVSPGGYNTRDVTPARTSKWWRGVHDENQRAAVLHRWCFPCDRTRMRVCSFFLLEAL